MQGILGDMQRAEELARQRDAQYGMLSPEPSMMQRIGSQAKRLFFPEKDLYGNDPMHPSVFDSRYTPTKGATNQDAILDVVGGPLTFAGKLAKTANLGLLKQAEEMTAKGATRMQVWKDTGWFKDVDDQWKFEIDDSWMQYNPWNLRRDRISKVKKGTMEEGLEHPPLTEAYPNINEMEIVDFPWKGENRRRGQYERSTIDGEPVSVLGEVKIVPMFGLGERIALWDTPKKKFVDKRGWEDTGKHSTLAHELQHAIQEREGFASGGSVGDAQLHYFDNLSKQYKPMIDVVKAGDALHADESLLMRLAELHGYRNIKQPRHLFNSQQWYKHSHTIRRELGPTPKYSGQKRKDWVRDAGEMLADIVEKEYAPQSNNMWNVYQKYGGSMDGVKKGLKNVRAKLNRLDKKGYTKAKRLKHEMDKHNPFNNEWTDDMKFQNYQRMAGEAEARNVQRRLNWTPAERKAAPPWLTLDVPENELLVHIRNNKGVLSGQ